MTETTKTADLAAYAADTAKDNGVDLATAIRMMRDEYPTVARDLKMDADAVKEWCEAQQ